MKLTADRTQWSLCKKIHVVSALKELRDHLSVHVGQAEVAALIFKGEFGMIDPEAMQKSGLKVMNMHWVFGHVV